MTTLLPTVAVATRRQPTAARDALEVYQALARHFGEDDTFLLESTGGPESDRTIAVVGFHRLFTAALRGRMLELSGLPAVVGLVESALEPIRYDDGMLMPGVTPWDALRVLQGCFDAETSATEFRFGFLAFFGYDAVWHMERLPREIPVTDETPDLVLSLYQGFVRQDLSRGTAELVVHDSGLWPGIDPGSIAALLSAEVPAERPADLPVPVSVTDSITRERFEQDARRCLEHIAVGDIYQIQIGHQLTIDTDVPPIQVYRRLRERNPSPYMYLAHVDGRRLIGASPELFVKVVDGTMTMRPIAGTVPRRGAGDDELAARLRSDPKERAEHVMLVDLCRNDIGRVCEPGTLAVPDMATVETFSHVLHLVSTVTGELRNGLDAYDVVRALFPAGTMTGAPKIRAMELIEAYETSRRGAYAGALGLFDLGGYLNLALCIRMLVHDGEQYRTRASAGIVADSVPAKEWNETIAKLSAAYWAATGEELTA